MSLTYLIGAFVNWRALALIGKFLALSTVFFLYEGSFLIRVVLFYFISGTIPCLVQLLGIFFIPESPRWLVSFYYYFDVFGSSYTPDNEFEIKTKKQIVKGLLFKAFSYTVFSSSACHLSNMFKSWRWQRKCKHGLKCMLDDPIWLQAKIGRERECETALQRLRGENADISQEAAEIRVSFETQ